MKILIVDDEQLSLDRLKRLLGRLGYEDITQALLPEEALQFIKDEPFDVVFLDINMPNISGIELAYEMKYIANNLAIIFQTAYEEHALEAFDIGAIGYLVKPFTLEALQKSMDRIKEQTQTVSKDIYFMSRNGENYYMIKPEDIYYLQADLTEVMLRTKEGFSYYPKKISDTEKMLEGLHFTKIHRSILVNVDKIRKMETIEQSKLRFSFVDIADQVDSSKDGAKQFRQNFGSK